jgi:hypothetical protein
MNIYLQQRVNDLLNQHNTATLATCGPAGPQISIVTYSVERWQPHLTLPHGSDHLFNLETQPALVLMTEGWRLHGQGRIIHDDRRLLVIVVTGTRLHVLNGQHSVETIDF